MSKRLTAKKSEDGFSLIELIIAMTITLVVVSVATTLIAQSLNIRTRSNENVDALADAERALNTMSREIAQAGFNLSDNGIVAADSVLDGNLNSTIRVRANLNRYALCDCPDCPCAGVDARAGTITASEDSGEDVKYFVHQADNTSLLARYDPNAPGGPESTVVANRIDKMRIRYFAQRVTYNTDLINCDITAWNQAEVLPQNASYVVIAVCVKQRATGRPGSPGYQPAHNLLLTSDVALRNANLANY